MCKATGERLHPHHKSTITGNSYNFLIFSEVPHCFFEFSHHLRVLFQCALLTYFKSISRYCAVDHVVAEGARVGDIPKCWWVFVVKSKNAHLRTLTVFLGFWLYTKGTYLFWHWAVHRLKICNG